MPTLLSLPNELLNHIISDVNINDIEAFSSCCKSIKLLAAARLEKHLTRKLNFPTIAIETTRGPDDYYSDVFPNEECPDLIPTSLLRDFLMDEENTLYPQSMSVGDFNTTHYGSEGMRSAQVTTFLEQNQGLEDKIIAKVMQIKKSLFTEKPGVEAHDWIDRIKNGNTDATAALLITLFPNVKTLKMFYSHNVADALSGTETLFMGTLERLTSAAAKNGPQALGTFSELSEIDLQGRKRCCAYGKLIAVFMILPSMRVIKGCNVHWSAFDWPYGSVTSSVKEILLERSRIHPQFFIGCLSRIEALERFTYDQVPIDQSNVMLWEPRFMVKALRKHARRTLVHLELTGGTSSLSSGTTLGGPFIGTLRSFQVLESVRLMTMMLFKEIDGEDIDESEEFEEFTFEESVDPNHLVEPRRLVDFLPSSARKLELVGGLTNEEARDMFADLPELKRERLPNLFEVVLEDSDPLEQETKDLCKNAGIRLKSIKRVVNGYQRIYAVTRPAPQVDDLEGQVSKVRGKVLDA